MERDDKFMDQKTLFVKMVILTKLIKAILIKISVSFSVTNDKVIPEFTQSCKGPRIAKTNLKEENKIGGLTVPDFKIYYYKTTVIKIVCIHIKVNRSMDHNTESGNRPIYIGSIDLTKVQKQFSEKGKSFQ